MILPSIPRLPKPPGTMTASTPFNAGATETEPFPGYIYLDAMAFGMGNCCIQQTFGTRCIASAAYLYDQYLPLTPILLVISSSCPVYKGKLSDFDNRFTLIMQGVDDRTDEERDPTSSKYICKSRYSPAYSYISDSKYSYDFYNDYPHFPINDDYYKQLLDGGLSPKLAQHFANILCRDPLVIFEKKLQIDDENDMTHFENLNSTNWNSLRFKLPRPADHDTCFKVEIRPCDLQITPYENTALFSLMLGLYGVIMHYDVNFILPISLVDENFNRAFKNDAINKEKFWWRINSIKNMEMDKADYKKYSNEERPPLTLEEDLRDNIKELTVNEIMNGCERYNYPGLVNIVLHALENKYKTNKLSEYIKFLSKRAAGELWTDAKLVRNFIMNHPKYQHNSEINEEINYDLICYLMEIQKGHIKPKESITRGERENDYEMRMLNNLANKYPLSRLREIIKI